MRLFKKMIYHPRFLIQLRFVRHFTAENPKRQIIFVLGGPGSGKGTQCTMISEQLGWAHLSAGELLRQEVEKDSILGNQINEYLLQGNIVPAKITMDLLHKKIQQDKEGKIFLIDGFPRNLDNVDKWNQEIGDQVDLKCALYYDVPEIELEQRLLERGAKSNRSDDHLEAIQRRFQVHTKMCLPVLDYFDQLGQLRKISGIGSPKEVLDRTLMILKDVLDFKEKC